MPIPRLRMAQYKNENAVVIIRNPFPVALQQDTTSSPLSDVQHPQNLEFVTLSFRPCISLNFTRRNQRYDAYTMHNISKLALQEMYVAVKKVSKIGHIMPSSDNNFSTR